MPSQKKSRSNKNENNVAPVVEPVVAEPVVVESVVAEPVVAEPVVVESKQKKTKKSKVVEQVAESVVEPVVEQVAEPVVEQVAEPVKQKGGKSKKSKAEPVVEQVAEPVKQKGGKTKKSKAEPVAEPVAPVKPAREARKPKQPKNEEPVATEPESEDPMDKTRSFKVMLPSESDYTGRFTGLTPYQAANKALSKYFRNSDNTNITEDFIFFSIKESTRRSKRNVYNYKGARVKLATPIEYKIKSENGEERVITKQYKNQLVKVKKSVEAKSETVATTA